MSPVDPVTDRNLGVRLGSLLRRDPTMSAQQLQGLVQDLLAEDLTLRAPLRGLIVLPSFRQLIRARSAAQAMAQRDALLSELAGIFHPDLLQRVSCLLDGVLGLDGGQPTGSNASPHLIGRSTWGGNGRHVVPAAPSTEPYQPVSESPHGSSTTPESLHPSTPATLRKPDRAASPAPQLPPIPQVSPQMLQRLQRIHALVIQGYRIEKVLGTFPVIRALNGRTLPPAISGQGSVGGFSWIGFFFPFVICFQIREWSYFWLAAIVTALFSLVGLVILVGAPAPDGLLYPFIFSANMALRIYYGIATPQLRYIHAHRDAQSFGIKRSILLGSLLEVLFGIAGEWVGGFLGGLIYAVLAAIFSS